VAKNHPTEAQGCQMAFWNAKYVNWPGSGNFGLEVWEH